MSGIGSGFALLLVAAVTNASFTLPMKFARHWAWENTWLIFSLFALVILPPASAYIMIPRFSDAFQVDHSLLAAVVACGAGWGCAQVLFGLAVDAIGIALAFSIILGLSAAIGSLIPLLRLHPEKIFSPGGLGVLGGVALVIVGVGVCAVAGRRREAASGAPANPNKSVTRGLVLCLLSGLGAGAMNFGIAFGKPILDAAKNAGADPTWVSLAVWVPLLLAGAIPNLAYCVYLMGKNSTRDRFAKGGTASHWIFALAMAVFWFGSTILYGVSAGKLGEWGAILGWPVFMSLIVITASVLGIVTGEWKNTGKAPLRIQMAGVAVLILAVFVLTAAGSKI